MNINWQYISEKIYRPKKSLKVWHKTHKHTHTQTKHTHTHTNKNTQTPGHTQIHRNTHRNTQKPYTHAGRQAGIHTHLTHTHTHTHTHKHTQHTHTHTSTHTYDAQVSTTHTFPQHTLRQHTDFHNTHISTTHTFPQHIHISTTHTHTQDCQPFGRARTMYKLYHSSYIGQGRKYTHEPIWSTAGAAPSRFLFWQIRFWKLQNHTQIWLKLHCRLHSVFNFRLRRQCLHEISTT